MYVRNSSEMNFIGELSERSKVPHSKCGLRRIDATWVRIPCSPFHKNSALSYRQRRCFCIDLSFMPATIIISAAIGHIALFTGITVPNGPVRHMPGSLPHGFHALRHCFGRTLSVLFCGRYIRSISYRLPAHYGICKLRCVLRLQYR